MKRTLLAVLAIIVALGLTLVAHPRFTKAEDDAPQLHDLRLVGTNDLQARSSYQPTVHRYSNNRWVIFVGHHALGTNPVTGDPLPSFNPLTGQNEENATSIVDVTDPANPVFLRDWALDGQQPGGVLPPNFTAVPSIHGPISLGPTGNRVYFAYGTSSNGVMQIADRQKILTTPANDYKTAEIGRF